MEEIEQKKLDNKRRVNQFRLNNPEKWKIIQNKWRNNNPDYIKSYNEKKKQQNKEMKEKIKKYENFILSVKEGIDNGVISGISIK